jgi:hypothetical protein
MIEVINEVNSATWSDPLLPLEIILTEVITRLDVLSPGPQGPSGLGTYVVGETPSGAIDGVNQSFTTAHNFASNQLWVWLNGLRMKLTTDYTITGANSFHFVTAPQTGDTLVVDYLY